MRQQLGLGWFGACVLSATLLMAMLGVFSAVDNLMTAPAAAAEGEEGEAAAETAGTTPEVKTQSFLGWLYEALGLLYTLVFLSLSFSLVALLVMNIISVWRDNLVPAALVQDFETHLNEKRYQEAYDLAKNDGSFLGKILSAGLAKLSGGYTEATATMQTVGEEENLKLEQRLSYVAMIAQVAPMFGLLGTVHGMIQAFNVIVAKQVTPRPGELAGGISKALVTTMIGLLLAIPALAAYQILRNRLQRLVLEAGVISDELMKRFSTVGTSTVKKA